MVDLSIYFLMFSSALIKNRKNITSNLFTGGGRVKLELYFWSNETENDFIHLVDDESLLIYKCICPLPKDASCHVLLKIGTVIMVKKIKIKEKFTTTTTASVELLMYSH